MTPSRTIRTAVEFHFAAARRTGTEASAVDGHNYRLSVKARMTGPDAAERIRDAVGPFVQKNLDHTLLDDKVPDPSLHGLAAWIWDRLVGSVPDLEEIQLQETAGVTISIGHDG